MRVVSMAGLLYNGQCVHAVRFNRAKLLPISRHTLMMHSQMSHNHPFSTKISG